MKKVCIHHSNSELISFVKRLFNGFKKDYLKRILAFIILEIFIMTLVPAAYSQDKKEPLNLKDGVNNALNNIKN